MSTFEDKKEDFLEFLENNWSEYEVPEEFDDLLSLFEDDDSYEYLEGLIEKEELGFTIVEALKILEKRFGEMSENTFYEFIVGLELEEFSDNTKEEFDNFFEWN